MVESATRLREELRLARDQSPSQQPLDQLPILYNTQDYFAKVALDTALVCASSLGKLFKLSDQFDPFFLATSVPPLPKGKLPAPLLASKLRTVRLPTASEYASLRKTPEDSKRPSAPPAPALALPTGSLFRRIKAAEAILLKEAHRPAAETKGEAAPISAHIVTLERGRGRDRYSLMSPS